MNDARFPWLVLVPRKPNLVEITDLAAPDGTQLMDEIARTANALRVVAPCDKLNIGALGNIVRQLHIHVVARVEGDAAWPGPVWGSGAAKPYDEGWMRGMVEALKEKLQSSS